MRGSKHTGLAVALLAAGMGQAAYAADTSEADNAQGNLEEIVVTSQKREQRLQDVPLAVSALTGDSIESRGVHTSDELTVAVPSLNWQKNLNAAPYIRGIGSRITTAGNQNSVPIFVDGVLQISPLQGNFNLFDIDRVEVLKGPQGTLFGRNANGGVISVFTHEPTRETRADASVGYANYNTADASIYGSTGITDSVAANLSADYHHQNDGWGRNILDNVDAYRDMSYDIRSKWKWFADEKTDVTLTGEYHYLRSDADANSISAGTLGLDGSGSPGFYNLNQDFNTFIRTKVAGLSLHVNHEFDFAKLVSITAYTRVRTDWPFDSDATPAFGLEGPIFERSEGETQEFQLVSNATGPFKWIAGLFFLNTKAAFTPIRLFGSEVGGAEVQVFGEEKARSTATFGELTYEFLPRSHITLGGRMTWDHRAVSGHTDVNEAPGVVANQSANFSQPTYRFTVDTSPLDHVMLYATVSSGYNSGQFNTGNAAAPAVKPEKLRAYEVGFKSEILDRTLQFNGAAYWYDYTDLQVTITQNAVTLQTNAASARVKGVELETVWAPVTHLSTGVSFSYTDATYKNYRDAQVYVPLPTGGYAAAVADVTGKRLILSPKESVSAFAQYEIPSPVGSFTPSVNYNYKSSFYWNYQNDYLEPSHNVVNASLMFEPPSGKWSVQAWAKNLLNEEIRAAGLSRNEGYMSAPAAPLTFGVTFGMHFQ